MSGEPRYAIGDLADLGGVSRRTVRYYVQEGLLPPPFGLGRGNHYGREHLDRLLRVKGLQETGHSLDEIKRALSTKSAGREQAAAPARPPQAAPREVWRRIVLAPGVELHVSGDVRLPPPSKLNDLANWWRQQIGSDDPVKESTDV